MFFPKGICPKVNVIAQAEFELVYYNFGIHRFNHYITKATRNGFKYFSLRLIMLFIKYSNKKNLSKAL